MSTNAETARPNEIPGRAGMDSRIVKSVALPSEHGGWAFLFEPILLGLLVAPSSGGVWLALAALFGFLTHQPLKIAVKDRLAGRRAPRSVLAGRFAAAYGISAAATFAAMLPYATGETWTALGVALPFAAIQFAYDARNRSREALAEIAGALALAALAPAIAVMGGLGLGTSFVLWFVLAARSVTSILYVRARLKLEHGKPAGVRRAWISHAAVLAAALLAAASGTLSILVAAAFAVLFVRALVGLSRYRKPRKAAIVGVQEILCGLLTVILTVAGLG